MDKALELDIEKENSAKFGRKVLLSLVGFFVFIACVNAFFIHKALSTNTGLVVEKPYERGLRFDEIIREAAQQKAKKNDSSSAEQHN